jgi:3-oxoacyl-[acyl-carrier protein] reductase
MSRKIVITGASSEIGLAICEKIVAENDHVILQCCKHQEKCVAVQENLEASCRTGVVDFTDRNELNEFCKTLGEVDILINAAAATMTDLLVNFTDEQIDEMMSVNILALIKICQAVLPGMVARRNGIIVNISSIAARRGNRGQTVYAGTKGFVESFTRALTAEYGKRNIRINCIAPGPIKVGSLNELLGYAADEVKQSIISPRLGGPRDIAAAVAFLCSEEAGFITGTCLSVDGGFCRGV